MGGSNGLGVLMAAIQTQDPLEALIRRHLTVNGTLHDEAYAVVLRWYTYLNAMANSTGHQLGKQMPAIGVDAVELAFETPVIGFIGNAFWQQHGHTILPLICQDMVQLGLLPAYSSKPDLVVAVNIIARYGFIGQVVALVQRDGLSSWKAFEAEFRPLMESVWRQSLGTAS